MIHTLQTRYFWGRYFCLTFLLCSIWTTIVYSQKETDTFNLNGQVMYQNGLSVSAGFRVTAENQRLKTDWFQQET